MYVVLVNADIKEALRASGYKFDGHDDLSLKLFEKLADNDIATLARQSRLLVSMSDLKKLGLVSFDTLIQPYIGHQLLQTYLTDPSLCWNVFLTNEPKSATSIGNTMDRINRLHAVYAQDDGLFFFEEEDEPSVYGCNIIDTVIAVTGQYTSIKHLLRSDLWSKYQTCHCLN